MQLISVLEEFLMERDLASITESQYRISIRDFSEYLGRDAVVDDLDYQQVNAWLKSLKERLAPVTISNRKKGITVIWNHLSQSGRVPDLNSRRMYTPKVKPKPVVSWTLSDFGLLIEAASKVEGSFDGISLSAMMEAWLWVGLDSAFRPSDMRELEWKSIDTKGKCITITQHKTSVVHRACLSDQAVESLNAIKDPKRRLVFPMGRDQIRVPLKRLYKIASNLGFTKISGRSIGTLRRLHATLQYEDFGASVAAESLGHVGGTRTVLRSYVDHRSRKQGRLPRHEK